jgi:hypothetical protein
LAGSNFGKLADLVREATVIDRTVNEVVRDPKLDISGVTTLFGVRRLCLIGGTVTWSSDVAFLPVDLTLPINVTNTLDQFKAGLAFRPSAVSEGGPPPTPEADESHQYLS